MKLPITWLNDYVDVHGISPQIIADTLLRIGFEVEEIQYLGEGIEGVVVGKIEGIEKHPNADKLRVCQISVGKKSVQIVTNSPTVEVGNFVPVALHNAKLASGKTILEGELRGVKSDGMLCGGEEIKLKESLYYGSDMDSVLILKTGTCSAGEDIKGVLGLDEYVLDISITANRPDCQGVYGIAREVAAAFKKPLKSLAVDYKTNPNKSIQKALKVSVKDKKLCPKYMIAGAENVKVMPSHEFIASRLLLCGLRPINNLVDITNFILLELAQPMHAFDYSNLEGKEIIVKTYENGSEIVALDDKKYILGSDILTISDGKKPVAIAGIMGGKLSAICETTTAIAFEAAVFARQSIRLSSRKINLKSDSSAMFEKGVSYDSCELGLKRALHLFDYYGYGDVFLGEYNIEAESYCEKVITIPVKKVLDVLGITIEDKKILEILNGLNISSSISKGVLTSHVPKYRTDIDRYPDLAEELIRMYGYDNIEGSLLKHTAVTNGQYLPYHGNVLGAEVSLINGGYSEIITYSFIGEKGYKNLSMDSSKAIRLKNPLGEEISIMRTQLASSMLSCIAGNILRGNACARLFEIAAVYLPKSLPLTELPVEKKHLCMSAYGEGEDFYTLKGAIEDLFETLGEEVTFTAGVIDHMHTGRCARVFARGEEIGYIGEIHPYVAEKYDVSKRIYLAELEMETIFKTAKRLIKYKNFSRHTAAARDMAIVVKNDVLHGAVASEIKGLSVDILESVELFDVYQGAQVQDGYKSMAYKLVFRHMEKTLSGDEVQAAFDMILLALTKKFNCSLRQV